MNLSSNFNRLSFSKLPLLKQPQTTEAKAKEEPVVVQKQQAEVPTTATITASALDAEALQNMNFISTAATVESKAAKKTGHLTEAEAKAQGYTIIKTADDLVNISKSSGTKFILMNDIDLSTVKPWKGIELKGKEFNGNGFAIENLSGGTGLFSVASDATISNVTIKNADVKGGYDGTGLLVSQGYGPLNIDNCNLEDSNVSGDRYVGALVGVFNKYENGHGKSIEETLNITNCKANNVNVKGKEDVGGLLGYSTNADVVISGVSFSGNVEGTLSVGGLAGRTIGSNVVNGKRQSTQITNCTINANIKGDTFVGGVLGLTETEVTLIKGITGKANVTGYGNVGGIVGRYEANTEGYCGKSLTNLVVEADGFETHLYNAKTGKEVTGLNDYNTKNAASAIFAKITQTVVNGSRLNGTYTDSKYIEQVVDNGKEPNSSSTVKPDPVVPTPDSNPATPDKPEEIQYKFPDLIDMKQDEKDMKDAAYKQGLTESPCSGVYSKQVRSGNGYKTVYYIWNSNDKEFERCNDIKSINADGSYVNNRGKTINKPANEQIAARVGGYTPTVEEGTYFKDGKYYNYDEDSNEFFEVDKSLYEVHDKDTTKTEGTKTDDANTDKKGGVTGFKIPMDFKAIWTLQHTEIKVPFTYPLYKRFEQ